jgi:hypothetical protein
MISGNWIITCYAFVEDKVDSLSDRQYDFIVKEYDLVQSRIRDYDTRLFQIKGWSITIFSAAIGLAIAQDIKLLLIVPFFSCLIFWGLDALYKSFQHIMIDRSLEIEKFVCGSTETCIPANLSGCFCSRDKKLVGRIKRVSQRLFVFNVMALYIGKLAIVFLIFLNMN